ncbi:MAG TPA: tRNA modification GTPase [Phycisphaerae bacterium]|nr:tRNA modification GTPase [Phycisphaerae bacterium]
MYTSTDDTIVAISSAPGGAPRGIVRMSGPAAVAIADGLCRLAPGSTLACAAGFTVHAGEIVFSDVHHAPVDVYLFRAPRSYTRQDLVELHTIGSPPLLDLIVERCLAAGARSALPGEFTARAFLAGALSLGEAEAVAATIHARSDVQLRAAQRMRTSHVAEDIAAWQDELAQLRSLVEADIDFAEEPIDFITPTELAARVGTLRARLLAILTATRAGERIDVLPRVLLMGLPNAGKSTLLNRLSGINRAIASAVAGTTRDLLTAPARFGDVEALLIDSAGWDDAPDELVSAATGQSETAARQADVVCLVVDAASPPEPAALAKLLAQAAAPPLVIANKCDLLAAGQRRPERLPVPELATAEFVWVSALTGEGMDALSHAVERRLASESHAGDEVTTALSARQRAALGEAAEALARCVATAEQADDLLDVAELIAVDLCEAQDALAELTGAVTTEDLLGRIFASFCIGK